MEQQSKIEPKRQKTGGRRKGQLNKTTSGTKEAITKAIEANGHKLGHWFNRIEAEEGPGAALRAYCALAEYVLPKERQLSLVTTHIDVAAILDRARSRILDVTPIASDSHIEGESVAQIGQSTCNVDYVKSLVAYEQQVNARVQAEIDAPYDPTELDGADDPAP